MRYEYRQWDGREFPTQEALQEFGAFLEFILEHGDAALEALRQAELDPEQQAILDQWIKEGLLEKIEARFRLTPRAIDSLQRKALMEIFSGLQADSVEGHQTVHLGRGGERVEGTKPYAYGDPAGDLDLTATLKNALARQGPGTPIRMDESDFEVGLSESRATCSTVILLDMSGSMARWQRFASAKRCAMAIHALVRQRFALDTIDVVGFHTGAEVIPERRLPLVVPKEISSTAANVRIRVPLDQVHRAPQHFTNLQLGLMTARRLLARRGGRNKQVLIITDGQPTAHVEGAFVHLLYPPAEATVMATLGEAKRMARQGIRFSTFALIEDYFYMDWVGFVDQLSRLTRGVAFYCTGANLASAVMESYVSGRKCRTALS